METNVMKELTRDEQMLIFGGEVKLVLVIEYDKEGNMVLIFRPVEV